MTASRTLVTPGRFLAAAALLLLIAGCIPVKDVSRGWAMGAADEALSGRWVGKNNDSETVAFAMTDADCLVTSGSSGLEGGVRTIELGEHKIMIVAGLRPALEGFDAVDEDSRSGNLLRYTLVDNTLTIYQFDSTALENAIDNGEVDGIHNDDEATTLTELDDATLDWIEEVSGDDAMWTETVYVRQ